MGVVGFSRRAQKNQPIEPKVTCFESVMKGGSLELVAEIAGY